MKLQRATDGQLYWFGDVGPRTPDKAIAGPFDRHAGAYMWFVAEYEEKLSGARLELWADAVKRAGTSDPAHLMGLMMAICAGRDRTFVMRAARPVEQTRTRAPERMMLAAGDKEAA